MEDLVNVNIKSAIFLTHGLIPHLLENAKDRLTRSLIVNVSSASSLVVAPLLSAYSGAKSFINSWSEGLNGEYSHTNLHVITLAPWFIATKMSKLKPSPTVPTPKAYVVEALDSLTSNAFHGGFLIHSAISSIVTFIPTLLQKLIIKYMHGMVRQKGHKKHGKQAELDFMN